MPPLVRKKLEEGQNFNAQRRSFYSAAEVRLDTGKVVDSYEHREEIVERKHSQLADIQESTAIGYLRDLVRKYSPGEEIAGTPRNREHYPELVGKPLEGEMILEVPVQNRPIPRAILEKADELDITIRDTNGREFQL